MRPKKRPVPEEFKVDGTTSSTEALCRAVKRLHTYSPHTSSCTTSSKDLLGHDQGEEASSSFSATAANWMYPEITRLGISETFEETDEEAAIKSEMVDRNSEEAARLSNEGMHGSFKEAPSEAMRQLDGPDASVRIILDNSKMGLASHELSIDGSNSIQQGIANIQRGLANINVTSPRDDSADAVPPPGTPGREETVTPSANKGHRLGTRTEASKAEAYDEVYEQANTLLKNLHFEWLHRKATI